MCSGKSTICPLLAQKLDLPHYPLDMVRWYYHFKAGFKLLESEKISKKSQLDFLTHMEPYRLDAVEQVVKEFSDGIIEFGAAHSHFKDPVNLNRAKNVLGDIEFRFLLLPTTDQQKNLQILNQRLLKRVPSGPQTVTAKNYLKINKIFLSSKSAYQLANHTIYTQGKTPEQVAEAMIKIINGD